MATKKAAAKKGFVPDRTDKTAGKKKSASTAEPAGWFQSGWDATEEEETRQEQRRANQQQERRFFLTTKKPNNEANIIFWEDQPFNVREHEFMIDGDWQNKVYKTCLGPDCPFCTSGNRAYFISYFSVCDTRSWQSKRDPSKKGSNDMKLFGAKSQSATILRKLAEKHNGSLAMCKFSASRTGKKSPRTGDLFQYDGKVNLKDPATIKKMGFAKPPQPFNRREVLKPMTKKEANAWLETNSVSEPSSDATVNYDD
jgi:hypothetical protein